MEVNLISGQGSEAVDSLLPIVQDRMEQLGFTNIKSIEEGDEESEKSIAIDSRTGQLYNLQNIIPTEIDNYLARMRGGEPRVTSDKRSLR